MGVTAPASGLADHSSAWRAAVEVVAIDPPAAFRRALREQRMLLGVHVLAADMPETNSLWATISGWWPAIEVLLVTGVTNGRTEGR